MSKLFSSITTSSHDIVMKMWSVICQFNLLFFHIFPIFSLFNLLLFRIFQICSLFSLPFFHIVQIISLFNLLFFRIFHIFSLFNFPFFHISHIFSLFNHLCSHVKCTTLCDQVCQRLATGQWFSPGPPVSSTNKTDRHDITEILLKVALNTIKQANVTITFWSILLKAFKYSWRVCSKIWQITS